MKMHQAKDALTIHNACDKNQQLKLFEQKTFGPVRDSISYSVVSSYMYKYSVNILKGRKGPNEALSVLLLCVPVFIVTSSSSALFAFQHCSVLAQCSRK